MAYFLSICKNNRYYPILTWFFYTIKIDVPLSETVGYLSRIYLFRVDLFTWINHVTSFSSEIYVTMETTDMSAVAPEHKVECAFLLIEEITFFVLVFFYRKKEDIALTLLLYKTPCLLFERGPPAGKIKRGRFPACVLRRIGYNMGCSLINRA